MKLTQAQASVTMKRLKAVATTALKEFKATLTEHLVPPMLTQQQVRESIRKIAYDDPERLIELYVTNIRPPCEALRVAERREGYQKMNEQMAEVEAAVEDCLLDIEAALQFDTFDGDPITQMSDLVLNTITKTI